MRAGPAPAGAPLLETGGEDRLARYPARRANTRGRHMAGEGDAWDAASRSPPPGAVRRFLLGLCRRHELQRGWDDARDRGLGGREAQTSQTGALQGRVGDGALPAQSPSALTPFPSPTFSHGYLDHLRTGRRRRDLGRDATQADHGDRPDAAGQVRFGNAIAFAPDGRVLAERAPVDSRHLWDVQEREPPP